MGGALAKLILTFFGIDTFFKVKKLLNLLAGEGGNLYHAQKKRCFKSFPNVGRFFEKMSKIAYFGYGEMKMTLLLFQARPFETAQIWPEKTKEAGIEEASRTTTRKSWRTRSEAGRV